MPGAKIDIRETNWGLSKYFEVIRIDVEELKMTNKFLFQIQVCIKRLKRIYAWHKGVKTFKRLVFPLLNVIRLISDRLNGNLIKATFVLILRLDTLRGKSGLAFVSPYLKACHIYTMQYVSGNKSNLNSSTYGLHVSLTKSGIPRILPSYLREGLRRKDPIFIRIVLTIFNLYRVLPFRGKVKLSTITDGFVGKVSQDLINFIPQFGGMLPGTPFTGGGDPFKISTSGSVVRDPKQNSTSGFLKALCELRRRPHLWDSVRWFFLSATPFEGGRSQNEKAYKSLVLLGDILAGSSGSRLPLGKLAFKDEPGKVRVFAMVDCITQGILRPLHDWIFEILRNLSTDATFDQDGGVEKIRIKISQSIESSGKCPVFSLDLSAATDRLPIAIQIPLLNHVLPSLGLHGANLLVGREYIIDDSNLKKYTLPFDKSVVSYGTGQPMGAYSSGGMLALTHHFIVQFCYWKVYKENRGFSEYMVLGDDIIILDPKVAKQYLHVMRALNVGVNLSKSLISTTGCAEFAKKFITPKGRVEGLSLKEFSSLGNSFSSVVAIASKLRARRVNILRLLGFGSLSSGSSIKSFVARSHKSFLDHLFTSPLVVDSNNGYEGFFKVTEAGNDDVGNFHAYAKYLLGSFEIDKYKYIQDLGMRIHVATNQSAFDRFNFGVVGKQSVLDDRILGLLNFGAPTSFTGTHSKRDGVWFKNEVQLMSPDERKFIDVFSKYIFDIFSRTDFLMELTAEGSAALYQKCLTGEIDFEEETSFSDFESKEGTDLGSVLTDDPALWSKERDFGNEGTLDIEKVMQQVQDKKSYHPCRIKDISKALGFKDFLISRLYRGKTFVFAVPGVRYPKVFNTKKVDSFANH